MEASQKDLDALKLRSEEAERSAAQLREERERAVQRLGEAVIPALRAGELQGAYNAELGVIDALESRIERIEASARAIKSEIAEAETLRAQRLSDEKAASADVALLSSPGSVSVCPNCGKALDAGAKFCNKCGAQILAGNASGSVAYRVCPKCFHQNAADARFCKNCGTDLLVAKMSAGGSDTLGGGLSAQKLAPIVLKVLLIISFFMPWFVVDYYFGDYSCTLFSLSDLLDTGSSYVGYFSSYSSSASDVSAGFAAASVFAFIVGAVPVALLAYDIFRDATGGEGPRYGLTAAIVALVLALLVLMAVASEISDVASSFGVSGSSPVSLGGGWWFCAILVAVNVYLKRKGQQ